MKKYRIKKRKKALKVNTIFLIIIIFLITISIGYSLLEINLNINGTAKIRTGRSIAYWKKGSEWDSQGIYYYQIELAVNNRDGNISNWNLSLDVPPYVSPANIQAWGSSETTVEEHELYDRVKLKSFSWNRSCGN